MVLIKANYCPGCHMLPFRRDDVWVHGACKRWPIWPIYRALVKRRQKVARLVTPHTHNHNQISAVQLLKFSDIGIFVLILQM